MKAPNDPFIPSAMPKSFALPSGKTALVIIDMQRDFIAEGGYGMYQCPSAAIFAKVSSIVIALKKVLEETRKTDITVIHTREGHDPDLNDCAATKRVRQRSANPERHKLCIGEKGPLGRLLVRGEFGHETVDELKPLPGEIVLDKPGKGSFFNTSLYHILTSRGITHLILCGVTAECCVSTTLREANDRGFECCVLTDCTEGFDTEITQAYKKLYSSYDGLFGYSCTSCEYLDSLRNVPSYMRLSDKEIPLNGYSFFITEKIPEASLVVERLKSKGAQMIGSVESSQHYTAQHKTFLLDIDTYGEIYTRVQVGCVFSPTFGTVPITDTAPLCPSFDKIAIVSFNSKEARAIWVELLDLNPMDPYFRNFRCFPTPAVNPYGLHIRPKIGILGQMGSMPDFETELLSLIPQAKTILLDQLLFQEGSNIGKILQHQQSGLLSPSMRQKYVRENKNEHIISAKHAALLQFQLLKITKKIKYFFESSQIQAILVAKESEVFGMINSLDLCAFVSSKSNFVMLTSAGLDWRLIDLAECLDM